MSVIEQRKVNGKKLLEINNLSVSFRSPEQIVEAVKSAHIELYEGDCIGVVGESGSGKSVTSLSILNLIKPNPKSLTTGSIHWNGGESSLDLLRLNEKELAAIRGNQIALIFQEAMSSLNPVKRCGNQIAEVLKIHNIATPAQYKDLIFDLLRSVELNEPERVCQSYPHELSGGQLQRVNIAMALAGNPKVLICDEPTTALDVTVQKKVIELLKSIVVERNLALIFVCHDLDLVAQLCNKVVVMYRGDILEQGVLPDCFDRPKSPYTKALLACRPKPSYNDIVLPTVGEIMSGAYSKTHRPQGALDKDEIVLSVKQLSVKYRTNPLTLFERKKYFTAVINVSFDLHRGEVLGIVGESGSGKSTIAKCISGVVEASKGEMEYQGVKISKRILSKNKELRRKIQIIFQDPYGSLNPRMTIGKALLEPISFHKLRPGGAGKRVNQLLDEVGLDSSYYARYPHELSGGQRQRVCIARALALEPEILICDESLSALDVSIQAQILNLLDELKGRLNLSLIFISHDLSVVHYISDNIIVMKDGIIIETGSADDIIDDPQSNYTRQLVDSIPALI